MSPPESSSPATSSRRSPGALALALALAACTSAPPPISQSTAPRSSDPAVSDASERAPRGAKARHEPRGKVIVIDSDPCGLLLDQIYFEPNSASLRPAQRPIVDATADMFRCFLRTGEVTRWQVVGNADATEREPAKLARARARIVADALVARGVDASTLDVTGVGATEPQDRRGTPEALAKNRRVYFLASRRGSSP